MSAVSTSLTQSGKRRIFLRSACEKTFSETRETVFFALRTPADKVMLALTMPLVKGGLSAMGFVPGGSEETVLRGLERASHKAQEINAHLLRDLPVPEVQRDERWRVLTRQQARQAEADGERRDLSADGRQGVWVSFAPQFRRILATCVGPRTFASAWQRIEMTAAVVLGVPGFFRDGFRSSLPALLAVSHPLKTFPRPGKRGRPRQPVQDPHPERGSAQGVNKKRHGRLHELVRRVCCGAEGLEKLGLSISTRVIERLNLTLRHALAPLVRKSQCFGKERTQMRRRVVFLQAFSNFARPPMRVRLPLPEPEQQASGLIRPTWVPRTPGMAAGLTDHVWTFRELLTAKVEPIHHQNTSG